MRGLSGRSRICNASPTAQGAMMKDRPLPSDCKEIIRNAIKVIYQYDGKTYITHQDYYVWKQGDWRFIFEEGNYSCDCNKSLFIQRQCDPLFPDMKCGDKIKMTWLECADVAPGGERENA